MSGPPPPAKIPQEESREKSLGYQPFSLNQAETSVE
jgi:hypothetical protein